MPTGGISRGRGYLDPNKHTEAGINGSPNGNTIPLSAEIQNRSQVEVYLSDIRNVNQPCKKDKPQSRSPEEVGLIIKHKSPLNTPFPTRPGKGTLGKNIKLLSNCFLLSIPNGLVYHYDVDIIQKNQKDGPYIASNNPKYKCLNTKRNRQVINTMFTTIAELNDVYPAYDGRSNLFTRKRLDNAPFQYTVFLSEKPKATKVLESRNAMVDTKDGDIYMVIIKPVEKKETNSCAISLDPIHALFSGKTSSVSQEAVMALETILRNESCLRYIPIGRSFFYPPAIGSANSLGGGCEIWYGYHQSMRLGEWSPMVNIDISSSVFYEDGPVIRYVCNKILNCSEQSLCSKPFLTDSEILRISRELRNLKVQSTHLSYERKNTVLRLTKLPANKLEFEVTENGQVVQKTVQQYFRQKYNISLKFPQLPCIQVGKEAKKTYIPIELCKLVSGQQYRNNLDERQRQEMIKFTARSPKQRFMEIEDIMRDVDFNRDEVCQAFSLKLRTTPTEVTGRVISGPNILYKDHQHIQPKDGNWNMRDAKFFKGAEIKKWVLISFASPNYCTKENLAKFSSMLCSIGQSCGIAMDRPADTIVIDPRNCKADFVLKNVKSNYNPDLVVIVLSRATRGLYAEIKKTSETFLGLKTQCIKEENVKNCKASTLSNLCMKINTKVGGINTSSLKTDKPEIFSKPVIIIGADASHPAPTDSIGTSLAAAVGSMDAFPSRYAVTCRTQTHRNEKKQAIETIVELESMVKDLLKAFYRNTSGKKPEKIIFFRDGVSEGQFEAVRNHEVNAIRAACRSLSADYQPGITFIVTQKRHHVRFFPPNPNDGVGKMKNVPPGTIVDSTVTHPLNFDFYLCSQFGLQGTSRPAHYTVLEDDNKFTSNELQKLTYYLCHMYARCTKSISVPAPVMYAHLAAFRARQYIAAHNDDHSSDSSFLSRSAEKTPEIIKVVDELKSSMYFV